MTSLANMQSLPMQTKTNTSPASMQCAMAIHQHLTIERGAAASELRDPRSSGGGDGEGGGSGGYSTQATADEGK
uniref:Uncharacterized protein n=1 Tax=Oryza punctata TaxID=4537 RepID=A0A0E0K5K5_ORYPU